MARTRRSFSPQFKAQTVLDLLTGVSNQAEICRQHQLSPALVARWKATVLEQLHRLFEEDSQTNSATRTHGRLGSWSWRWRCGSGVEVGVGRSAGLFRCAQGVRGDVSETGAVDRV